MIGPEDTPPRTGIEREGDTGRESDVERPIESAEAREAEEVTSANLAMNDEFMDAGNEAHLGRDAGIDDQPGDGGPDDDVDTTLNSGIVRTPAG
jgi:hypothetical protein